MGSVISLATGKPIAAGKALVVAAEGDCFSLRMEPALTERERAVVSFHGVHADALGFARYLTGGVPIALSDGRRPDCTGSTLMGFMDYGAAYGTPDRRPPIDFEGIRQDNPVSSVAGTAVKLIRAGREWKACCPFHSDRSPSFTIFADDRRFQCFGCGAQGDVIDFVGMFHKVGTREAAEMLGGGSLPTVQLRPLPARTEPERDTMCEALAIWRESVEAAGTPAEAYLRRRGITMALPPSIRFSRLRYGARGALHPALVAAICNPTGGVIGIQRTYLTEEGGKAAFDKVKLSLGRARGGSIHLAPAAASVIVTEGLEDGLTLAQETGRPVWVAAGTSMLPLIVFPDVVSSIAIGADGDAPGEAAAQKAGEAYAACNRVVNIMRPTPPFKDFNAELMAVMS